MFTMTPEARVPNEFGSRSNVVVPVDFLLDIHNQAPADHPIRASILAYIKSYAKINKKAHWARGIVQKVDGSLHIDRRLQETAIYRGKQDTYVESAEKAFDNLQSALSFVSSFQIEENRAVTVLADTHLDGVSVVPLAPPSQTASHLKMHAEALAALVKRMEGGLSENLSNPGPSRLE
jgi:hypothetical protein